MCESAAHVCKPWCCGGELNPHPLLVLLEACSSVHNCRLLFEVGQECSGEAAALIGGLVLIDGQGKDRIARGR